MQLRLPLQTRVERPEDGLGFAFKQSTDTEPVFNHDAFVRAWTALSLALNSLTRSMGMLDPYPFAPSAKAHETLRFVHDVIESSSAQGAAAAAVSAAPGLGGSTMSSS